MSSSRRCDEFHRSDAMSTIRVAAENAATRMCTRESQRRTSLRLTINSDDVVAAYHEHRCTEISAPMFVIAATRCFQRVAAMLVPSHLSGYIR